MKHWLLGIALICWGSIAHANPYFRFINPAHPHPTTGALLDTKNLRDSEAAVLLPLVTHSPTDGCIFPSIICEDWSPISIGGSMNAGKITFDVAPVANIVPWIQNTVLFFIPSSWIGLVNILSPEDGHPVTFSAGPVWEYRQLNNKGYFKIFTGLQLNF